MTDPDPRPVIAARLDGRFMDVLLKSGRAQTEHLLNRHISEGSPWAADWHDPDPVTGNYLTITAGAVRAWLARHPEAY